VIVATTADVRVEVVEKISCKASVVSWVLEKVLAQNTNELIRLKRAIGDYGKAWVNTPMHLWPLYQNLRECYSSEMPLNARFSGFRGLACNAIHYIDFISRWNDATVTKVDTTGLHSKWYPAKREGFFEIDGVIKVEFSDGSKLTLCSDRNNLGYKVDIEIDIDQWHVSEAEGIACNLDGRVVKGGVSFQSKLTAPLIEAIFSNKPCGLPTLNQSVEQHTRFLESLLTHWNDQMPIKLERLPIT
jgi:hypothetical protein